MTVAAKTGAVGGRPNRVLAIVVGAMIALATLVVVFSANRSTADFDPATPEGTVQAYVSAVVEGDYAEAAGLLAADSSCDVEDLDRIGTVDQRRVYLVDSQVVAEILGLKHRNSVTTYLRRYSDMPRPVVELGEGRVRLWLRPDIEAWARATGRM